MNTQSASLRRPTFGPYATATAALVHCNGFLQAAFPGGTANDLGVIWIEHGTATVLRPPVIDSHDQLGASVMVEWHGAVAPHPPPPPTGLTWTSIDDFVRGIYADIGKGIHTASAGLTAEDRFLKDKLGIMAGPVEEVTGVSAALDIRGAWRWAERELDDHPAAAAIMATALDAIGVVGGLIGVVTLSPGLATVVGAASLLGALAALVGSGLLLWADGWDTYYLVRGDMAASAPGRAAWKTRADKWEHGSKFYERTELLAPLLVLPDAARAGIGVTREVGEAREGLAGATVERDDKAAGVARAAERLEQKRAENAAREKLYRAQRQTEAQLGKAARNAAKRLLKAEARRADLEKELRAAIRKSALMEGPGLLSAAGGAALYIGHLPEMMSSHTASKPQGDPYSRPLSSLIPQGPAACLAHPHHLSFSITVSSPLTVPPSRP
ncbi:hypothetical protein FE249_04090 [Acidiphilium multivorum]|uniref:hypothetical protein n=1 Tax=Acidiphilium multivorum TaxID=62140 RepID=UPI001F4BEE24|nr:hypothetical protein [Acidiphilium multivorum]UNC13469.1 hypothetical protein FE249_04090 [Acidiphilium multivorum]